MIGYAVAGFITAIIFLMMIAVLWQWATAKLEHWEYNLMRKTHQQLLDADRKLDSILYAQQRMERTINNTLSDLRSRLTSH